jgi:hypothetical protein
MHDDIRTVMHGLSVQPLLDALLPDMWEDITIRQQYPGSAHADTECIFLRGPRNFFNFFDTTAQDYPRLPQLIDALTPVLLPLLATIDCAPDELGRVMLVKLKPLGHVKLHTDEGAYADAFQRHHVVLSTNDRCTYACGDTTAKHVAGDAFWFDHHKPHHSHNYGSTDRIHLIVDTLERRGCATNWGDLCPKN